MELNWNIKSYQNKRAIEGKEFKKKKFLGLLNGKKHYSIGRGNIFFNQYAPKNEVWGYE